MKYTPPKYYKKIKLRHGYWSDDIETDYSSNIYINSSPTIFEIIMVIVIFAILASILLMVF